MGKNRLPVSSWRALASSPSSPGRGGQKNLSRLVLANKRVGKTVRSLHLSLLLSKALLVAGPICRTPTSIPGILSTQSTDTTASTSPASFAARSATNSIGDIGTGAGPSRNLIDYKPKLAPPLHQLEPRPKKQQQQLSKQYQHYLRHLPPWIYYLHGLSRLLLQLPSQLPFPPFGFQVPQVLNYGQDHYKVAQEAEDQPLLRFLRLFFFSPQLSPTHAMASSAYSTSSTSNPDISTPRSISPSSSVASARSSHSSISSGKRMSISSARRISSSNPMSSVDIATIQEAMRMANLDTLRGYNQTNYGEVHQDATTEYISQNQALGYQILDNPLWNKGKRRPSSRRALTFFPAFFFIYLIFLTFFCPVCFHH